MHKAKTKRLQGEVEVKEIRGRVQPEASGRVRTGKVVVNMASRLDQAVKRGGDSEEGKRGLRNRIAQMSDYLGMRSWGPPWKPEASELEFRMGVG